MTTSPCKRCVARIALIFAGAALVGPTASNAAAGPAPYLVVTNVSQLQELVAKVRRVTCSLRLEGIVCASSDETGVIILQDDGGAELLELGRGFKPLAPGERIRIESPHCLLRRRDMGVQISAAPFVDNDGLHPMVEARGSMTLPAGRHALCLEWFNASGAFGLETSFDGPGIPQQALAGKFIVRGRVEPEADAPQLPGLRVDCFQGTWENIPDFDTLRPVQSGVATNIDLKFTARTDAVGLRFMGFFDAPRDGQYSFRVRSDDGALLFLGDSNLRLEPLGMFTPPTPISGVAGEPETSVRARRWIQIEGRVSFVTSVGLGLVLELRSESVPILVRVADASGLNPALLLNSRVRVIGLSENVLTSEQQLVLGRLCAVNRGGVTVLEAAPRASELPPLLTTAEQVRGLPPEQAARRLPVHIRGVVTSANSRYYRGLSLQDATRGIYVDIHAISKSISPETGEFWEVRGRTGPGDFAPVVIAEHLACLGQGEMPPTARPTWNQLVNGSMDVQWIELQGLVTGLASNRLSLLLPGGTLEATMSHEQPADLQTFVNALVRIRGTLYAQWNAETREVVPGRIVFRSASINVDASGNSDPFNAPLKSARELLRFDPQAAGLERVKVRSQVMRSGRDELFCADGNAGLRVLPATTENVTSGDLIEAAGYPEIGGPSPLLRHAVVRKLGVAALPDPAALNEEQLSAESFDSTRIRVRADLAGLHNEKGVTVLEMQAGLRGFLARIEGNRGSTPQWRIGSRLELTGIYSAARRNQPWGRATDLFEVLLNSPADVRVISQPPWWTLRRLLAVLGVLSAILAAVMLWAVQLRRRVDAQTRTIRDQIEKHATLEERARIARELHDTLEQALAGISLQLDGFSRTLGELPADSARALNMARAMVRHGQDEARRTVRNLRTLALEKGDLPGALAQMAANARNGSPVNIQADHFGARVPLTSRTESHLLRIGQEATTNALKHAQARNIRLRLRYEPELVELVIHDDGCGFDIKHALPSEAGHFGLLGMRERAEKIGGTLSITSEAGEGTTVQVRLPLNQNGRPA